MSQPVKTIDDAFAAVPDLKRRIYKAITIQPQNGPLFNDISNYILSVKSTSSGSNGHTTTQSADNVEPPAKKRKLDEESSHTSTQPAGPRRTILEAREISFTLPQRKKLHLGIVQYGANLDDPNSTFAIQARNQTTNQVEFEYPISTFAHAMRLPVPEKNQKQYNFCLIPHADKINTEALIWTVNHGPLKSCKIDDPDLAKIAPGPEDILENALSFVLEKSGIQLLFPSDKEFASAVRESHRKNDVTYHVKAHRGSKEGYLFFLTTGIFFGFKKPLSFFPFHEIESISYTSVLQRTFNLNITIRLPSDSTSNTNTNTSGDVQAETQEIEYSMLDQQDFAGIDAYIRSHDLQDGSLAAARRAKKVNANKNKVSEANGAGNGGEEEDDGRTELEKAEAEMEDEEDELEEDYDPDEEGSGSGSESGSGSDDDDDAYEYEKEYKKGKGRNLVAEELGSEAEDVSVTEDEEDDAEEEEEEEGDEDEPKQEEKEVAPVPKAAPLSKRDAKADVKMTGVPKRQVPIPSRDVNLPRYGGPELDDEDQL